MIGKILYITISLLLISLVGFGQLSGRVGDANSGEDLFGAHILIKNRKLATVSSSTGSFSFAELLPGSLHIKVSYVGYVDHDTTIQYDGKSADLFLQLKAKTFLIDPVVVSASLTPERASESPVRLAKISAENLESLPVNTTDQALQSVANIYVNRPWGVFSKGASVSMHGLSGSSRTLVLLDGVPLNKSAGGTLNWNFITPDDLESIEIVKGPNSAIYGNNAMGGVISMQTQRPDSPLSGDFRIFGGSYNTFGGYGRLGGSLVKKGKGFFWQASGFYRKGDGYVLEPEETRDSTDVDAYLDEYNVSALAGYQFNSNHKIEIEYRYYDGKHGSGKQVYEPEGGYERYQSNLILGRYIGQSGAWSMNGTLYYQYENYFKLSESLSSTAKYKLVDNPSDKNDFGLHFFTSRTFAKKHTLTFGTELKSGNVDASSIYRTSTDIVDYSGNLYFAGLFVQEQYQITSKLRLVAGLRFDQAWFQNGSLTVTNPTTNTGFLDDIMDSFNDEKWYQLSPKIAVNYQFNSTYSWYVSISTGFMPPKLDDLCKSGKISKGFKLANPQLQPESITNYETGLTLSFSDKLSLEPSIYYMRGKDFQDFVGTGDSVDTGSDDLKPVLQRQNISDVNMLGGEITLNWAILKQLRFSVNFSMNYSEIVNFDSGDDPNKDLTGKSLIEVPDMLAYASIQWSPKYLSVLLDWNYVGSEWYDDENTQSLDPHHLLNLKISAPIVGGLRLSLTIQDLLNQRFVDRKGLLSPGRFILFEARYSFKVKK